MKKNLCIAIAVLGTAWSINAQSINIGVKAGVNFSNLTGDVEDSKIRTAFHAGAVVEFELSELFSFQPELLYSAQGTRQEIGDDSGDVSTITSKIDYLNIPLTAKIYLTDWLNVQVAPQVGFLLDAREESDDNDIETVEDLTALLKEVDFSLRLGAGYSAPSGFFFDAFYNLGLTNINDLTDNNANFKNGVIQVAVGYFF
ncbi:MAG: porin family protein [Bacteroidota bacterium]